MGRPEEHVHYWKLVAEETGCYDKPFPFGNDQARFLFYREPSRDLHYVPHESYRSTVTMMAGLPGSGKDTWLKRNRPELSVISLDDLRGEIGVDVTDNQGEVAQLARERCQQHLRRGESFAFNATNLLRQTRKRWIDLFASYSARIEIVYIEPPLSMILAQNRRRTPAVPETVIHKLAAKCEPPTWTEAHSLTLVAM
jgi:predicted kinase